MCLGGRIDRCFQWKTFRLIIFMSFTSKHLCNTNCVMLSFFSARFPQINFHLICLNDFRKLLTRPAFYASNRTWTTLTLIFRLCTFLLFNVVEFVSFVSQRFSFPTFQFLRGLCKMVINVQVFEWTRIVFILVWLWVVTNEMVVKITIPIFQLFCSSINV